MVLLIGCVTNIPQNISFFEFIKTKIFIQRHKSEKMMNFHFWVNSPFKCLDVWILVEGP